MGIFYKINSWRDLCSSVYCHYSIEVAVILFLCESFQMTNIDYQTEVMSIYLKGSE